MPAVICNGETPMQPFFREFNQNAASLVQLGTALDEHAKIAMLMSILNNRVASYAQSIYKHPQLTRQKAATPNQSR